VSLVGLPSLAMAVVGAAVYVATVLALRVVPTELLDAFRPRRMLTARRIEG
jgi:hypothetical protein